MSKQGAVGWREQMQVFCMRSRNAKVLGTRKQMRRIVSYELGLGDGGCRNLLVSDVSLH